MRERKRRQRRRCRNARGIARDFRGADTGGEEDTFDGNNVELDISKIWRLMQLTGATSKKMKRCRGRDKRKVK